MRTPTTRAANARLDRVEQQLTDPSTHAREIARASFRALMSDACPDRFPPLTDAECRRWAHVPLRGGAVTADGLSLPAILRRTARQRLGMPS